jgi:hypothetical protein
MTIRNLSRRLERLEARVPTVDQLRLVRINFVGADGSVSSTASVRTRQTPDEDPGGCGDLRGSTVLDDEALMKAIVKRLRRLEDRVKPIVNERGQTPAEVVRERRRRRLEAAGLPFEDPPWGCFAGAPTLAEVTRMGRRAPTHNSGQQPSARR